MDQDWEPDWIDNVKEITWLVYDEDYPSLTAADCPVLPKKLPLPSGDWPLLLRKATAKAVTRECDKLAAFWGSPCEPLDADPLQYWQGVMVSWPDSCLAKMAVDYLSSPASSVEVERAFSCGALTVTHRCHALSDTSTCNLIVLGAWLKDTNFVPKHDLIELFRNKSTCLTMPSGDSAEADEPNGSTSDSS